MSYDNLSSVSQNVLKFYQQLSGEDRMIPFIFDDFQKTNKQIVEQIGICFHFFFVIFQPILWFNLFVDQHLTYSNIPLKYI